MNNLGPAVIGAVIGFIAWKFTPFSADWGIGPLIFIIICAVGGVAAWGK